MFFEATSKITSSIISLPIAELTDSANQITATLGVGVPASALPFLADIKLFNHDVAEKIAKSVLLSKDELLGKIPGIAKGQTGLTGHWMDATGPYSHLFPKGIQAGSGLHRIHGHHFITDAIRVIKDPNLSIIDFYRHLGTDIVTKTGLPILPEQTIRGLAEILGTTSTKLMPWVQLNILDGVASGLAVFHAGSNVTSVFTGSAEWGVSYAIDTIGVGGVEIAAGVFSKNPFLIGAGATDVACGVVTAHEYYSQPFIGDVPVSDILECAAIGVGISSVLASIELVLSKKHDSLKKKVQLLSERISTAGLLSGMAAIAIPMSVTTSIGIVGCKLAAKESSRTNQHIKLMPLTGEFSTRLDQMIAEKYIGKERIDRMLSYLD